MGGKSRQPRPITCACFTFVRRCAHRTSEQNRQRLASSASPRRGDSLVRPDRCHPQSVAHRATRQGGAWACLPFGHAFVFSLVAMLILSPIAFGTDGRSSVHAQPRRPFQARPHQSSTWRPLRSDDQPVRPATEALLDPETVGDATVPSTSAVGYGEILLNRFILGSRHGATSTSVAVEVTSTSGQTRWRVWRLLHRRLPIRRRADRVFEIQSGGSLRLVGRSVILW